MYKDILINSGLTHVQAEILEFLLEKGEHRASDIGKAIQRPRGVVYKGLEDLIGLELAEKHQEGKTVATFRTGHPGTLERLFQKKEMAVRRQKKALEEALPNLVSLYNLAQNKPGVRFFEGEEGIKEALYDSLSSKTEIYTYADMEAVAKYIDDINKDYVRRRQRKGIVKKALISDTEFNRQYVKDYYRDVTDIKMMAVEYHFTALMEIYDGKIAIVTLKEDQKIGVIIQSQEMYEMQKALFEFSWNHAASLSA